MMIRSLLCAAQVLLLWTTHALLPVSAEAALSWEGTPDVHYVRTPHEVVAEMLRLAEVGAEDIVYDLGCGDGRIVITAARERGARGVGVDIDPLRVEESHRNAQRAGVSEQVRIVQEDLFALDFSAATVVALYLLPDLNLRLRPELLRQLQPGTRILSHKFHMGEWRPDAQSSVGRSQVYLWIIPANASGRWRWSLAHGQEEEEYQLQVQQLFQDVNGILRTATEVHPLSRASLRGDRIQLVFERGGPNGALVLEGRISGDVISGTVVEAGGMPRPWRAERDAATMTDLLLGTSTE
jgi:SAM-dependent methyltransferase